jgi:hypothetical protein
MRNVRFHIVDIGAKEDMRLLVSMMESNFCENECMTRNNELYVSRLLPLSTDINCPNANDTMIYPSK